MSQKILILYEEVGTGHKRITAILDQILREGALHEGTDIELVARTATELFDDKTIQLVVRLWTIFLQRNWLRLTDGFINFFLRLWVAPVVEALDSPRYLDRLEALAPDLIICTYDAFGKLLGTYAQEKGIPFYLVISDLSIFTDLVHPYATHLCYFPATINAIHSYDLGKRYFTQSITRRSTGVDKLRYVAGMIKDYALWGSRDNLFRNIDQVHPQRNQLNAYAVGPIVDPVYYEPRSQAAMRAKHGIDPHSPCLLVVSGGIGGAWIVEMVRIFQQQATAPLTMLAVCGRDQRSLAAVTRLQAHKSHVKVIPLAFVDYLYELYSAADVVLARPSAGVLLEALMCRTPLLMTTRATANDLGGIALIKAHGLGELYTDPRQAPARFQQMVSQRQPYLDNIERLLQPYPPTFAAFATQIRGLIWPAAQPTPTTSGVMHESAP